MMREVAAAAGPGADACDPAGAAWAAVTHVQNVENAAKVSKSKNFKPLEDQYLSIGYGFTDLSLYQASQAVVGTAKATSETPNHDWMHPMFAKVSESHNVLKLPYKKAFQKNKDDSSMPKSKIKEKDLQRRPEEQNEFAQAGPALPFSPGSSWQEVAGKSNEKTPPSMLMLSSQQIASSDISSRRNLNNNMCLKCYVKSVSSEASTLL
uniref:Uncharacterized protein n=1 Tax=Heterosigma akashiwo TaxID=2829 RepID=A0A7S4D486_HETAK